MNEPTIYAYTLDSLKLIKSFLPLGNDTGQTLTSGLSIQYINGESSIHLFDYNMQRFYECSLDSIADPFANVPIQQYKGRSDIYTRPNNTNGYYLYTSPIMLPNKLGIADIYSNLHAASNSRKINHEDDPNYIMKLFTIDGLWQSSIAHLPAEIINEMRDQKIDQLRGAISISNDGSSFIFHSYYANLIIRYDLKGQLIAWYKGSPDARNLLSNNQLFNKERKGYLTRNSVMSGSYVYIINANPISEDGVTPGEFCSLYVFNKNMHPMKRILLKGMPNCFDINDIDNRMYSLHGKELRISSLQ